MSALAMSPFETPSAGLAEELHAGPSPWEACLRLADRPHLLFLDSASGGELGRYSFVTADPYEWLEGVPLASLQGRLPPLETVPHLPPFQGGAAGLFGYDLCHQIERLPRPRFDEFAAPPLAVGLYDWVLAYDHQRGKSWLVSTGLPAGGDERRRRARQRLREVRAWLSRTPPAPRPLPDHRVEPAVRYPLRA